MDFRKAEPGDITELARLASALWKSHTTEELEKELSEILNSGEAAVFVAAGQGPLLGFAQCQLRHDYVEGTSFSPVGYLEGIYVEDACRGMGVARTLLEMCENWARQRGCKEFASDCELDNNGSFQFHIHSGFREANRIICFTKQL